MPTRQDIIGPFESPMPPISIMPITPPSSGGGWGDGGGWGGGGDRGSNGEVGPFLFALAVVAALVFFFGGDSPPQSKEKLTTPQYTVDQQLIRDGTVNK